MAEYDGVNEYLKKLQEEVVQSNAQSLRATRPINIPLQELKQLPAAELEKILNCESNREGTLFPPMAAIIIHELNTRREELAKQQIIREIRNSTKPHWSTVPNFWLIVFTLIATVVLGLISILKP